MWKREKGKDAVWLLDVNKIDWQDKFSSAPSAVKAIKLQGSRERGTGRAGKKYMSLPCYPDVSVFFIVLKMESGCGSSTFMHKILVRFFRNVGFIWCRLFIIYFYPFYFIDSGYELSF